MIAILRLFPRKGEEAIRKYMGSGCLGEPQAVSSPAGLLARAGPGVLIAAPFVRAIGASPAAIQKAEEETKRGEFRLQVRQIQQIKPCLHWALHATQGNEPDCSPFHRHLSSGIAKCFVHLSSV